MYDLYKRHWYLYNSSSVPCWSQLLMQAMFFIPVWYRPGKVCCASEKINVCSSAPYESTSLCEMETCGKKNDLSVLNCISNPGQVIILFWAVGLYWDRTSEWGSESRTAKRDRERRGDKWIKRGQRLDQTWATSKDIDIVSADGTRAAPGEPSACLGYSHTIHNSIFDKSILFCTWLLFCEALHAIVMIIFHLSLIQHSADPLQQFIAIIAFISHLFRKIEERSCETQADSERERWDTNSHQKSDAFQRRDMRQKKYEFAHAMKNDTSILSLKERKRGEKIPKRRSNGFMPACLFCFSMRNF